MEINISKKQYDVLVKCLETAGTIYGVLGDMTDERHKKTSDEIDALSDYILGYAGDFGRDEIVEEYRNKRYIAEEYTSGIMDDIFKCEEYAFWEMLVRVQKWPK